MAAPLKIDAPLKGMSEVVPLRAHYERLAYDRLQILWHRKFLICALVVTAVSLAATGLVLIGPRYTGEAIIQLDFNQQMQAAVSNKIDAGPVSPALPVAIDAVALVETAARNIRSRATASAVVTRLGLDSDPQFARGAEAWRALSKVRATLDLAGVEPTPHDLATDTLMAKMVVTNDPHTYLISIAITTGNAVQAAKLANAVALEYLRRQLLQQALEAQLSAAREIDRIASAYGERHPSFLAARARLESLQARLKELQDDSNIENVGRQTPGQSFVPAEAVMVPSGPNVVLVLSLATGAVLIGAIWLALLLGRHPRSAPYGPPPLRGQPLGSGHELTAVAE
jgi:uncharacterized protein involved in exopolysaccharide biosynthesis